MRRRPHYRQLITGASAVLITAAVVGCERRPEGAEPAEHPPAAPPETPPVAYPIEVSPGVALAVAKLSSRTYSAYGWTDRASRVRIEVEDGHNILFGPAVLPVRDERFRTEFVIEPTDRDHVFVYVTDGEGNRLAVIPIDTARALTTVGPEDRLDSDPGPLPE